MILQMDALDFLSHMKPGIADIVFLDPPFNLGKDYGVRSDIENADEATYAAYIEEVLDASVRILRPGGALFLYHVPAWASRFSAALSSRMEFRHWIAVSMKNGFVRGRRLYPAHYALLYFTKGRPRTFRRPKVEAQLCRHCGQLVKDYGGYRHIIERKGVNLSDVWEDLSPVRHRHAKLRTANQLPEVLTDRVVAIAGRKNYLLVDPFVGSGTSAVSAREGGMRFLVNDIAAANVALTVKRLRQLPPHADRT